MMSRPGVRAFSCVAGRVRAREPGVRRRRMRERPGEAGGRRSPNRRHAGRHAGRRRRAAPARVRDGPAGGRAGHHVHAVHRRPRRDGGAPADPRGVDLQPHLLLRRQGRAARPGLRDAARPSRSTSTRSSRRRTRRRSRPLRAAAARHAGDRRSTDGKVDLVAAQVTITAGAAEAIVDFSKPTRTNVSEVVVTGPGAPAIASVDDLSGQEVFVRKGSSYYQSLVALNERLKAQGKPPVVIREVAGEPRGRRPARDGQRRPDPDHRRRRLPGGVLEEGLHGPDRARRRWPCGPAAAWRSRSARTARSSRPSLNAFIAKYGIGTAFGNILAKRYLESTEFVKKRRVRSRAEEVPGSWSRCSRSTATSTRSTTC